MPDPIDAVTTVSADIGGSSTSCATDVEQKVSYMQPEELHAFFE